MALAGRGDPANTALMIENVEREKENDYEPAFGI